MSAGDLGHWVNSPWNFSWVVRGELCAMARPDSEPQVRFLAQEGVAHLVTLSSSHRPPAQVCERLGMGWSLIDVPEFEPPTLEQIKEFINLCDKKKAVGVHCRMGRGRTGVMAACFLVHFYDQTPQSAISNLRLMRPGSVETYSQERVVVAYHDFIRATR